MIRFACPRCGMQLSAPEECAGRSSKCRQCGQPVTVPVPVPDLGPIRFKLVAAGSTPKPEEILHGEPVEVVPVVEDVPMVLPVPEVLPVKVEVPPQRDRQRSRTRRNDDQAEQEGRKEQTRTFISIVTAAPIGAVLGAAIGAVVGVIVLGFVGLLLSQYWPVFGGFIELNLAQPWSQARMNLIPIHLFVFGITGLVLGAGAGFLLGAGAGSLFGFATKAPRSASRR